MGLFSYWIERTGALLHLFDPLLGVIEKMTAFLEETATDC